MSLFQQIQNSVTSSTKQVTFRSLLPGFEPGSFQSCWGAWGRHPLPNPTELANKLSAMGGQTLSSLTTIHALPAARSWWLLRYLGHNRVAPVRWGFPRWLSNGYPVKTPACSLRVCPEVATRASSGYNAVKARLNLSGVVLVDSRESDCYRGAENQLTKNNCRRR